LKKITFSLIVLLFCNSSLAQKFKGSVYDDLGNSIPLGSISFKSKDSTNVILDFTMVRNGQYQLNTNFFKKNLIIEIRASGFRVGYDTVYNLNIDSTYTRNFVLTPLAEKELKEVIIKAEQYPFYVKKDTVVFDVEKYKDTNTRKVEDVLKKLPGITVDNQTGAIKYKGKAIETVMLDGDNLFEGNYTMGTRGINIDIIEQIEAIEKFSENPLLKGIENSDKVALNLKLKKGKVDFSGNVDAGLGINSDNKAQYGLGGTLLGVGKHYKSFISVIGNNIGVDNAPLDYLSGSISLEKLREKSFLTKNIIQNSIISNPLNEERSNLNNQIVSSANGIFKIGEKIKIRTAFHGLTDKIRTEQFVQNDILLEKQSIRWSNKLAGEQIPKLYRGDLNTKINTSATSLLDYNVKLRLQKTNYNSILIANLISTFSTFLFNEDTYLNQKLLFTKRIADNKVFQGKMIHSVNKLNQTYKLFPSIIEPSQYNTTLQTNNTQKEYFEVNGAMLGVNRKSKYQVHFGGNYTDNSLVTLLTFSDDFNSDSTLYKNDSKYINQQIYHTHIRQFNSGKFTLTTSYKISYLYQRIINNLFNVLSPTSQGVFIIEPFISVQIALNENTKLLASASYFQKSQAENHFFINSVLTNNRSFTSNTPNFQLQKNDDYRLVFQKFDLYTQFEFTSSVNYKRKRGDFFNQIFVDKDFTIFNYSFLNRNSDELTTSLNTEKFIDIFSSNLSFNSSFSYSKYFNFVNSEEIRGNNNYLFNVKFAAQTAFGIPINFKNTISRVQSTSVTDAGEQFKNIALFNSFSAILNVKRSIEISTTLDYFMPNTDNSYQNLSFWDTKLTYLTKEQKIEISFIAKNLLNENSFEKIDTNDYSTTLISINVIPRYFMLFLSLQF